jgi:hypothetical protein
MNSAQVLENNLIMLIHALELEGAGDRTLDQSEELYLRLSKRTIGNLIRRLQQILPIPEGLEELLMEATNCRNFLAHEYFTARLPHWLTESGLAGIIDELATIREKLDLMAEAMSLFHGCLFLGDDQDRNSLLENLTSPI